jgi:hypothetical protein
MSVERVDNKSAETVYSITIPSGSKLGFTSSEQFLIENDFSDFILALNLTQKRICINYRGGDFQNYEVTPKVPKTKTTVTKSGGGYHLHSNETVVLRDMAFTASGIWGEIDENKVADIFQRMQKLKRFEKKDVSERQTMNLNDALGKYESGVSEFDCLMKFKHFFNSLELITTMANEFKGDSFDNEVARISSISRSEAKDWRDFYNRTKHAQKNSNGIKKYYDGVDTLTLTNRLLAIRTALNELFLSKL